MPPSSQSARDASERGGGSQGDRLNICVPVDGVNSLQQSDVIIEDIRIEIGVRNDPREGIVESAAGQVVGSYHNLGIGDGALEDTERHRNNPSGAVDEASAEVDIVKVPDRRTVRELTRGRRSSANDPALRI